MDHVMDNLFNYVSKRVSFPLISFFIHVYIYYFYSTVETTNKKLLNCCSINYKVLWI